MRQKSKLHIVYELAVLLLTVLLLFAVLFQLGYRLTPERMTYGSVWSSYLQEEEQSVDVLFMGSSRVYCNVSPARIFEKCGVTSYVMAGPSQTVSLTYYYLRECLKTQSPRYVFVEVSGAYYRQYEEHSLANVVFMPGLVNRVKAAMTCERGIIAHALYPLQDFHYRVYEPDEAPELEGTLLCGYTPMLQSRPQTERTFCNPEVRPGDERYLKNMDWLRKIAALCEENGITCVFYLAPTMRPFTDEESERLFSDLNALPCAAAEDWGDLIEEIGIDNEADWYDTIHFNHSGAIKFSDYLADYLISLGASPTPDADVPLWTERIKYLCPLMVEPAK